jgi:hypothetical protein
MEHVWLNRHTNTILPKKNLEGNIPLGGTECVNGYIDIVFPVIILIYVLN